MRDTAGRNREAAGELNQIASEEGHVLRVLELNVTENDSVQSAVQRILADVQPGPNPVVINVGNHASRGDMTMSVLGPDGRSARVACNNLGSSTVTIKVYSSGDTSTAINLGATIGGCRWTIHLGE